MLFSSGLGYLLSFLVVLTVLVFVHEMGHFLVARWAGVKVETFSIGFGPELFGRTDRLGTRWRISAIPFGGYVKWYGDADGTSVFGEGLDTMTPEERAVSFHHKPLAARAAVVAAGPAANFLFAIVVLAGMFMTLGQPITPAKIGEVIPGSAAATAGLQAGDELVTIDGASVSRFDDLLHRVLLNTGSPMSLVVRRDNQEISLTATPQVMNEVDRFGNARHPRLLGVRPVRADYVHDNPVVAVSEATKETWNMVVLTLQSLGQMIAGTRNTEDLGGPIGIMKLSGEAAQDGPLSLLDFMTRLSINLGLVNLFPIPVLDGGHLLFYAAEAALGRPLGRRTQEMGFRLGLAVVLTLMVFATWNDLVQSHLFTFLKSLVT